ncbi:ADP-ribosylation factor-binding protein Gga [Anticarsia gemmatalis]|uniref:ADP-ribosylation factor-binding protein Gga n=1 Tax=Anticarsia gemmatalis TaxID=129554 RepID=UPI003F75D40B
MNVTLTSLEALILKATHESLPCPDAAALEAFCAVMRDSSEGGQLAAQALAARIHTPNAREALLALMMLDRCMRRCDASFHAEIGKFRFLNEMIKLVSPKYFADRTSPEVRTRVLQLLHAWSIEYPKESKFKVAYDMLKNQGVVKETPPPLPPEDLALPRNRAKSAIFEDEEKSKLLQKLLQSKKPEDLQHANRLIKTMVREEERRNEESSRRAQEVGTALDSAELLRELLANAADASPEEEQLIHELHMSCSSLKQALQRLAAADMTQTETAAGFTPVVDGDILHASEVLDEVFEKYNAYCKYKKEKKGKAGSDTTDHPQVTNSESLLDFAGASVAAVSGGSGDKGVKTNCSVTNTAIDELGDIFSTESTSKNIAEPLKPVSLMPTEDVDLLGDKPNKAEGWNELDSLGEQLIKQSLPDNAKRLESFNGKTTKKIPMNALTSPKHEPPPNNGALFDLDFFTTKAEDKEEPKAVAEPRKVLTPTDDVIVDISVNPSTSNTNINCNSPLDNILDLSVPLENAKSEPLETKETNSKEEKREKTSKSEVRPLTDIHVTLDSVQPSSLPPRTAYEEEEGVTVVLHFCKDKPRPDVNVIVVSTTSKNTVAIQDYEFRCAVPKGCKARLLTPSGTVLPPYNRFLPPPAITQVLLIGRPSSCPQVDLKFVITYTTHEEDTVSEIGEVKDLPLEQV